jgi:Xaa-Pro aminopeptidase
MAADEKLTALRLWMADRDLDAVMIPRGDVFQGEEVPPSEDRLRFISGFTGSAGVAVITADHAALFSDGRYTLQMAAQVGDGWTCHTQPEESVSSWMADHMPSGSVGVDGQLITLARWRYLEKSLPEKVKLESLSENPIDEIWADRPEALSVPAWTYPEVYAGQSREDKIEAVLKCLDGAEHLFISGPDQLCWLLNIRGSELAFTPFYRAFGCLDHNGQVTLFTDTARLNDVDHARLTIMAEDDMLSYLAGLKKVKISIDPDTCPYALADSLGKKAVESTSPIIGLKARKNKTEIDGFRAAHCRDAVAMIRFLVWLDETARQGLREVDACEKLLHFRQQVKDFISPSFATICGSGANSAIVHYRAMHGEDAEIATNTLCLIDSGGQYLDATTDITRTVVVGVPSQKMKHDFTHVLKAHIALDQMVFPKGTTGAQLDAITRAPLWAAGMDFDHGTGHGVGCCLGVHEGPVNISKRGKVPIEEGMFLSNEPGYYIEGEYGIRIENLIMARAHPELKDHLYFERVTMVPIDRRLIDPFLLTSTELAWINNYHHEVQTKVGEGIAALDDDKVSAWFDAAIKPISN